MKVSQVKIITGTRIKKDVTPEVNEFLMRMAGTAEIVNISHSSYYDAEAEDEVYSVLIHYTIEEEVLSELQGHKKGHQQEATPVIEQPETTHTIKKGATKITKKAKATTKAKS
jgi:hypothetical protein